MLNNLSNLDLITTKREKMLININNLSSAALFCAIFYLFHFNISCLYYNITTIEDH
jgi:hypothetical protein